MGDDAENTFYLKDEKEVTNWHFVFIETSFFREMELLIFNDDLALGTRCLDHFCHSRLLQLLLIYNIGQVLWREHVLLLSDLNLQLLALL